jgi:hypothetical protein
MAPTIKREPTTINPVQRGHIDTILVLFPCLVCNPIIIGERTTSCVFGQSRSDCLTTATLGVAF